MTDKSPSKYLVYRCDLPRDVHGAPKFGAEEPPDITLELIDGFVPGKWFIGPLPSPFDSTAEPLHFVIKDLHQVAAMLAGGYRCIGVVPRPRKR